MSQIAKAMHSIQGARQHHDTTCRYGGRAVEVHLNPDDAARLGLDDGEELCGLRIVNDAKLALGRMRVYCDVELDGQGEPAAATRAISTTTIPAREAPLPA